MTGQVAWGHRSGTRCRTVTSVIPESVVSDCGRFRTTPRLVPDSVLKRRAEAISVFTATEDLEQGISNLADALADELGAAQDGSPSEVISTSSDAASLASHMASAARALRDSLP